MQTTVASSATGAIPGNWKCRTILPKKSCWRNFLLEEVGSSFTFTFSFMSWFRLLSKYIPGLHRGRGSKPGKTSQTGPQLETLRTLSESLAALWNLKSGRKLYRKPKSWKPEPMQQKTSSIHAKGKDVTISVICLYMGIYIIYYPLVLGFAGAGI